MSTSERAPHSPDSLVKSETLLEFESGELHGQWLRLENMQGEKVEGSLYQPDTPNDEIVIFHPGLPGGGVKWFEEKHVPELLKAGYAVFVARHTGLEYTEQNQDLIHNEDRLAKGSLDTAPTSMADWVNEPKITLEAFSNKKINLVTHSFSGLSAANSLIELQKTYGERSDNPLRQLKSWVLLSGFTSNLRTRGHWDPANKSLTVGEYEKWLNQIKADGVYRIEDTNQAIQELRSAFANMKENLALIPSHIRPIAVHPEADKIISLNAGLDLQKNLGRGILIDDKTFREDRLPAGATAHDFPHLLPATLLRLIQMKPSDKKHRFTVSSPDPKK